MLEVDLPKRVLNLIGAPHVIRRLLSLYTHIASFSFMKTQLDHALKLKSSHNGMIFNWRLIEHS